MGDEEVASEVFLQQRSPDHAMQCLNGGFIHKRHDGIRDAVAMMIDEIAYDDRIVLSA